MTILVTFTLVLRTGHLCALLCPCMFCLHANNCCLCVCNLDLGEWPSNWHHICGRNTQQHQVHPEHFSTCSAAILATEQWKWKMPCTLCLCKKSAQKLLWPAQLPDLFPLGMYENDWTSTISFSYLTNNSCSIASRSMELYIAGSYLISV